MIKSDEPLKEIEKVATPDKRTIEEVASFFDVDVSNCIKTLIFNVDGELVVVLGRGDHEINDIKLKNALYATSVVEFAYEGDVLELALL